MPPDMSHSILLTNVKLSRLRIPKNIHYEKIRDTLLFTPLISDVHNAPLILAEMKRRLNLPNHLIEMTSQMDTKRAGFSLVLDSLQVPFRLLTWRDTKIITCGTYQVSTC